MMNIDTASRMAGHKLVAGFEGTSLPEEMIRLIREHKVSNVILFRRNIESREQLKQLCRDIQTLVKQETGEAALITIDQEGGAVSRLPEGSIVFPSQMAIAASEKPQNAYDAAYLTGLQLLELGVNFNLSPVMDLNLNMKNPVIGTRSYSDRPDIAARFGQEAIRAYHDSGVFSAAKHFPGHGDTAVDSHVGLPTVDKTLDDMRKSELASFAAAIDAGVPAVMISHILYPKLQENPLPATMSRDIVTDLLKNRMGFSGLAISDCMMMDAILKFYGTVEGCISAAKAGMDLIFVSHDPALAAKAAEGITEMLLMGGISQEEALLSEKRVISAKRKVEMAAKNSKKLCSEDELRSKSLQMAKDGLCLVNADKLPDIGANPLCIGSLPFRASYASDPAAQLLSFPSVMAEATGGRAYELPDTWTLDDIPLILESARDSSAFVLCVQGIRLSPQEEALLKKISELKRPAVCVTLRTPYPLSQLPEGVTGIAAFDYSFDSLSALADVLTQRFIPSGKLPVQI